MERDGPKHHTEKTEIGSATLSDPRGQEVAKPRMKLDLIALQAVVPGECISVECAEDQSPNRLSTSRPRT